MFNIKIMDTTPAQPVEGAVTLRKGLNVILPEGGLVEDLIN